MARAQLWFGVWTCGCSDVRQTQDFRETCPCHPAEGLTSEPVEVTPGVSTNLGHLCPEEDTTPQGAP